jgi:hypothetical protein
MAASSDGSFVIFAHGAEGFALYRVTVAGGLVSAFGGSAIAGSGKEVAVREGFVAVGGDRVTLVPRDQYAFLNFRGSGEFIERRPSDDAEFQPHWFDKDRVLRGARIMGAYALPGGDWAVNVITEAAGRGLDGNNTVDVHGASKQNLMFRVRNPHGVLAGADGSGALYFFWAGRTTPTKITKARIVDVKQAGLRP